MKKKRWKPICDIGWKKIFIMMRITVFFLFAGLLQVSASIYSQQTSVQQQEKKISAFDDNSLKKISTRLEIIIKEQKEHRFDTQLKEYLIGAPVADNFTGFRLPDLEKFTEMIRFFAEKLKPYKTKLNKLLFYADFIIYERSGFSMSGMRYIAIQMGPVPDKYDSIYDHLTRKDDFDIIPTLFTDGGVEEKFMPNAKHDVNSDLFSSNELTVLEEVAKKFKNTSTKEIIDISHKEKGWIVNKATNGIIDYKFGFDIVL